MYKNNAREILHNRYPHQFRNQPATTSKLRFAPVPRRCERTRCPRLGKQPDIVGINWPLAMEGLEANGRDDFTWIDTATNWLKVRRMDENQVDVYEL